jgi:hypothetical protein
MLIVFIYVHQMDGVRVYPWKELGVTSHQEAIPLVMGKKK